MIEITTAKERATAKRRQRILEKFAALAEQHPDAAPSRLCLIIADGEKKLADGVTSVMGVKRILIKEGIWQPKRQIKSSK